jgi:hypothetical protein
MASYIGGIISLSVGVVVLANVYIQTVKDTNTTALGFTTSETTMWSLLTLVGIVGFVYGVLNLFGLA